MASTGSNFSFPGVEGETPSPLCNHLLEQARLRFEEELSEEELKEAVASALKSLEEARGQTLSNLEENGVSDEVYEAFERSFEEMQIALEDLREFASDISEDNFEFVRQSIIRAASATVFAMSTFQESQFKEGPTDMPMFNALFQMKEKYKTGGVEADQLKDALAGIVDMTKKAIEELLAAEGEQPPQRDGLVRAYKEQIENLELVEETLDKGDEQKLDQVFEDLLKTSNSVKEAIGSLNHAIMSKGPCRLERTNVLLSAAEAFEAGGITVEAFAVSLEAYESQLREEMDRFHELAAMPNKSEAVAEEIEGVREAYDLHEDALAVYSEIIEAVAGPEEFSNARKLLIEASEKLSDHKEALTRIGEAEGKVSCVRCGTRNEPGRVCNNCGAQLPQQTDLGSSTMSIQESDGSAIFGDELEMTTNLEKLFQAVNDIAEDRISDEEFEEVLVWMDGLTANAIETMPEVPDLTPRPDFDEEAVKQIEMLKEDLHEQRDGLVQGMANLRAALGTLQAYFQTREKETLVQGVREVRDAAVKMQQAEKGLNAINQGLHEAQRKAQESAGEPSEAG